MNKSYLILVCFICLHCAIAFAQSEPKDSTLVNKENQSPKGDLKQLVDSVYLSFKRYTTGSAVVYKNEPLPPIIIYNETKKDTTYMSKKQIKPVPIEKVKSVVVTYNPEKNCIYGTSGLTCIIEVTIKDDETETNKP